MTFQNSSKQKGGHQLFCLRTVCSRSWLEKLGSLIVGLLVFHGVDDSDRKVEVYLGVYSVYIYIYIAFICIYNVYMYIYTYISVLFRYIQIQPQIHIKGYFETLLAPKVSVVLPDIVKWLSFNNCVLRLAPAWRAIFVEGDPLLNASNLVEVELMSSC